MAKRALLVGGTGAIGHYMVPELLEMGYELAITSRAAHISKNKRVKYIQGDAHDLNFMQDVLKEMNYDAVIDFMVYSTDEFLQRYELLLNSCKHYIFLSSYRVFAETDIITESSPRLLDVSKDAKYLKTDEYALAKARQEDILRNCGKNNWSIVRPAITYSSKRLQLGTLESNIFIWRSLNHLPVALPDKLLRTTTTMTWAGDVARLISKLVQNKKAYGDEFNIATRKSCTWTQVLDLYKSALEITIVPVSTQRFNKLYCTDRTRYQLLYDRLYDRRINNSKILDITGEKEDNLIDVSEGLIRELKKFLDEPAFDWIDYASQARMDILTNSQIDLSAANANELEEYMNIKSGKLSMLRKIIRPRTRLKSLPAQLRKTMRPRSRALATRKKISKIVQMQKLKNVNGAILTLNGYFNYGNMVQRYALQKFLTKNGYKFVSYEHGLPVSNDVNDIRFKWTHGFVKRHILTKEFDASDNYDTYIVGSDQVWRNWGYPNVRDNLGLFFLNFTKNKKTKRIAYAASFGQDTLEKSGIDSETAKYLKTYIQDFHAISVREKSAISLLKQAWKAEAVLVADPVMLLTTEDYNQLIDQAETSLPAHKELFAYILTKTEAKSALILRTAEQKIWDVEQFMPRDFEVLPPVEQWLNNFKHARFVITDSFHGMMFSILYNKPFWIIEHDDGGVTRIFNALTYFGLEDRLLREADLSDKSLRSFDDIDWELINERIKKLREFSSDWLLRAVSAEYNQ